MSAVDAVEAEVRELVRRRGLDPIEDRPGMRRLVDEVVTDYDERALTSALAPLSDSRQTARAVYDAVAGFGSLQRHLDDPTVEEVWINERLTAGWSSLGRSAEAWPLLGGTAHHPSALVTSVWLKSWPLNSRADPLTLARA